MGDGADLALDQGMAEEEEYMSNHLELEESPIPDYTYYVGRNKYKRCQNCGLGGLHWQISKGSTGWRLYDKNGEVHNCNKKFAKGGKRIIFE